MAAIHNAARASPDAPIAHAYELMPKDLVPKKLRKRRRRSASTAELIDGDRAAALGRMFDKMSARHG